MDAVLKKEIVLNRALVRALGVAVFVVLTALGAFVRLPLPWTPVPVTLQTFFVLASGIFLGSSLGLTAQLSYVFLGAIGLPIFSGAGSGPYYLFGPTGGYLCGFVIASFFAGKFIKYGRDNFLLNLCILCAADIILLCCGVIWLKIIFRHSLSQLLAIGFIPFIPGDLLKTMLVAAFYTKLKTREREVQG